ncbi:MAG: DNA polymerase III subunit beta [bacterium]
MKIEIGLKQLCDAVTTVARVVASKPQLPVLSNILLTAEPAGIRLSATDLEIGMSIFLPAKVEEVGKTTVPARVFLDYITSISGEKVLISEESGKLQINAGTYKGQIQTIGADEFPILPNGDGDGVELLAEKLSSTLGKVIYASAKDSLRPVLTGILFEMGENKLKVVGTDGFRLALCEMKIKGGEKRNIIVPARAVLEMMKLSKNEKVKLLYLEESKQIVLKTEDSVLMAQVLEGNFPDYTRILPKNFALTFSVNREELLQVVKSVQIFARDNSNVMRWSVGDGEVSAIGEAGDKGQGKASCPAAIDQGESSSVVFNAKYVMDFLTTSSCENVKIGLGEALAPGSFQEEGDEEYLYVVMPINA